jgi:hypothetical protein
MSCHRRDYKSWINKTHNYMTSYEILKYGDAYIELVEECEFASKQEMQKREGHFIRTMECVNKLIAGRTTIERCIENASQIKEQRKKYYIKNVSQIKEKSKKYYVDNPEKIKEKTKEYQIKHAEHLKEQHKKYYVENAEQIKEKVKKYNIKNADKIKEYEKEYRIENAEQLKEKAKEYRIDNVEQIKEKAKEIITCNCGCIYTKSNKARHLKSKKHLDFIIE